MKNTVTDMKNDFDVIINRLDMAEDRFFELKDISVETDKNSFQN